MFSSLSIDFIRSSFLLKSFTSFPCQPVNLSTYHLSRHPVTRYLSTLPPSETLPPQSTSHCFVLSASQTLSLSSCQFIKLYCLSNYIIRHSIGYFSALILSPLIWTIYRLEDYISILNCLFVIWPPCHFLTLSLFNPCSYSFFSRSHCNFVYLSTGHNVNLFPCQRII